VPGYDALPRRQRALIALAYAALVVVSSDAFAGRVSASATRHSANGTWLAGMNSTHCFESVAR